MANKRDLKKVIRAVCGDIASECILARHFIPGIDSEKMTAIVIDTADLQYNTLANVSFSFDKSPKSFDNAHDYLKARKAYFRKGYRKLRAEFDAEVIEIVNKMNSALSDKQKELNKSK